VARFKCLTCGKTFSSQTFCLSYYDKLEVSYEQIILNLPSGQGLRQTARAMQLNHKVVARRLAKLVPQALSLHAHALQRARLDNTLVFDGFESFAYSQYYPNSIQLLVGQNSQVVWGFNIAPLRRKGRMTETQRQRRAELELNGRPDPHLLEARCQELFESIYPKAKNTPQPLTLVTDKHPAYPRALQKAGLAQTWAHQTISSRQARTKTNPLFAVNYLDRQFRKDLAEHVRETTRWAKRPEKQIGRVAVYLAWHHVQKPFRINGWNKVLRHLELAGWSKAELAREWKELLQNRRFGTREALHEWHRRVWNREDRNPTLHQQKIPRYLRCPRMTGTTTPSHILKLYDSQRMWHTEF